MKIKIAILGSTGSIGKSTLKIIQKNKKDFEIILLMANNNYSEINKQISKFNVKNLVISNNKVFKKISKKFKNKKICIFESIEKFHKKNKTKVDYTISAINGLSGLRPTLYGIKFSKKIAIANKESLICAWNLINKELIKNNTKFIPVDSEHFSIYSTIINHKKNEIDEIIITASGGPFLKYPLQKFNKIKPSMATSHPNWNMGAKISVDSATMMNKIFEVIEAKKIFNLDYKKIKILIHPKSYLHSIVKFNNATTKLLIHDPDMKIPIFNSIYENNKDYSKTTLDLKKINNLDLQKIDLRRFPCLKLLSKISKKDSLFETVLVSANDELVDLFLKNKISFNQISKFLIKILSNKQWAQYKHIVPKKFEDIAKLNEIVRLKTRSMCIYSS